MKVFCYICSDTITSAVERLGKGSALFKHVKHRDMLLQLFVKLGRKPETNVCAETLTFTRQSSRAHHDIVYLQIQKLENRRKLISFIRSTWRAVALVRMGG